MKSILALVLFFSISLCATAQEDTEIYLQEAAEYVCSCYEEKIEKGEADNAEMAVGTCMITFLEQDRARAEAAFGAFSYADVPAMTRIGEQLGVKMASICPKSLMELAGEVYGDESPTTKGEITGTLKDVSFSSQVVEVTIQEGSGRPVKLYWLEYFPGSEALLEEESLTDKTITLTYENQDVFSGTAKEYITRRVITGLNVE